MRRVGSHDGMRIAEMGAWARMGRRRVRRWRLGRRRWGRIGRGRWRGRMLGVSGVLRALKMWVRRRRRMLLRMSLRRR